MNDDIRPESETDWILSGFYELDGQVRSYSVSVHGVTRDEAVRVLAAPGPEDAARGAAASALTIKPRGPRRLGVGKSDRA